MHIMVCPGQTSINEINMKKKRKNNEIFYTDGGNIPLAIDTFNKSTANGATGLLGEDMDLREQLNKIDHSCIDNDLKFYDLRSLYESVEPNLSSQDKSQLKQFLSNPKITAKDVAMKINTLANESYDTDETLNEDKYSDILSGAGAAAGTALGLLEPTPFGEVAGAAVGGAAGKAIGGILDAIHQHRTNRVARGEKVNEAMDNAWSFNEVYSFLRDKTNEFTESEGHIRTYYASEKESGVKILKKYYRVVETSDGRRDADEEPCWVIAYAEPKGSATLDEAKAPLKEAGGRGSIWDQLVRQIPELEQSDRQFQLRNRHR